MRKKVATAVALGVLGILLMGFTVYAAPPPGCEYTGRFRETHYVTCDWCRVNLGNVGYPDRNIVYTYWEYECPDGSKGWELITIGNYCVYYPACDHSCKPGARTGRD